MEEYCCETKNIGNIFFSTYFKNKELAQKFIDDVLIPLDVVKKLMGEKL